MRLIGNLKLNCVKVFSDGGLPTIAIEKESIINCNPNQLIRNLKTVSAITVTATTGSCNATLTFWHNNKVLIFLTAEKVNVRIFEQKIKVTTMF